MDPVQGARDRALTGAVVRRPFSGAHRVSPDVSSAARLYSETLWHPPGSLGARPCRLHRLACWTATPLVSAAQTPYLVWPRHKAILACVGWQHGTFSQTGRFAALCKSARPRRPCAFDQPNPSGLVLTHPVVEALRHTPDRGGNELNSRAGACVVLPNARTKNFSLGKCKS